MADDSKQPAEIDVSHDVEGDVVVAGDSVTIHKTVVADKTQPRSLGRVWGAVGVIATLLGVMSFFLLDLPQLLSSLHPAQPTIAATDEDDETEATAQPTSTSAPTPTPEQDEAIKQAVINFDLEMRYLLETNDTSRIDKVAKGDALQDRLDAAAIQEANGCRWRFTARSREVHQITYVTPTHVVVNAELDLDGTVFCGEVERTEYAFEGPISAQYVVEFTGGKWWVTDFEKLD